MTISELKWLTFAPIDLGARISSDSLAEAVGDVFLGDGWLQFTPSKSMRVAVGDSVCAFSYGETTLFLPETGFAVLCTVGSEEVFTPGRPFRAEVHLHRRRSRHQKMLELDHPSIPSGFAGTVLKARRELAEMAPSHRIRPTGDQVLHYVMSTYVAKGDCRSLPEMEHDFQCQLAACMNPSLVQFDDTPYLGVPDEAELERVAEQISSLDDPSRDLIDFDPSSESVLLVSWSSVFAVGSVDASTEELLKALQVRTQSSWLAAWTVGELSKNIISQVENFSIDRRRLGWMSHELRQIRSATVSRVDPTASDRVSRIAGAFATTSGLDREWDRAVEVLEHANAHSELVLAESQFRNQKVIEGLLLVFAFASFAPLFLEIPITTWGQFHAQIVPIVCLAIPLALGLTLVARRKM